MGDSSLESQVELTDELKQKSDTGNKHQNLTIFFFKTCSPAFPTHVLKSA